MKICFLSDANSVHTKKWCNFFTGKGYEVVVISLGDGDIPGVKVYSLGQDGFSTKSDIQKLKDYNNRISQAKQIVERENPDILHAHYATSYGTMAARINRHPYILSVWGSDVYDFPKKTPFHRFLLKHNLKKADVIMSTSKDMMRETRLYTAKNILVTPFGVDVDVFKPIEVERDPNFTVGTIKSFYPKYGIEYLITGFNMFMKKVGDDKCKLILGGKGPQEDELRQMCARYDIEKNVDFIGFLDQKGVIEAFNKMDVAAFPSTLDSESFGVAAVEAGACGVPLIVSNVGGLPEATKPGYSSLTVRKKHAEDICDCLVKLYKDTALREEMGRNARQYVLDNYNIVDNFNFVDDIYKKIISKEYRYD